jgi:hypothetical protein
MNMPGMAGEASVYKTNNHYSSTTGTRFLVEGNADVTPQDCGPVRRTICRASIAGTACGIFCADAVHAGPAGIAACAGCWFAVLPLGLYPFCKDCIPLEIRAIIDLFESDGGGGDGGGGGGGGEPPPPPLCNGTPLSAKEYLLQMRKCGTTDVYERGPLRQIVPSARRSGAMMKLPESTAVRADPL